MRVLAFLGYLAVGLSMAIIIDYRQMRRHVPYENWPSILSLRAIRLIVYILCTVFYLPVMLWVLVEGIIGTKPTA